MMLFYRLIQQKSSRYAASITLFLCSCFLLPFPAEAAREKVVFQLSNFRHWTELEYEYTGKSYDNDTNADRYSQEHVLTETYHLDIDYAILDRDLANGSLAMELGLDQVYEDENGAVDRNGKTGGFLGEYLFELFAFERRFYPVNLVSSLTQERISAPFTENYDQTRQSLSAAVALRNSLFPVRLSYRFDKTETSGLEIDRIQETEELAFSAGSTVGDFSETRLYAETSRRRTDLSSQTLSTTETDTDEIELYNLLRWGSLRKKSSLNSRYRLVEDRGTSERQISTWDEDLKLQLGQALSTELSYGYRSIEALNQEQQQYSSEASIEHQLFDSLTTRLGYSVDQTDYLKGEEQEWQSQISLVYTKILPRESRLNMSYSYQYSEMDRNLLDQELTNIDEAFSVNVFLSGFLEQLDIIPDSIVVYNADRSIIYNIDTEYRINIVGRRTELEIVGGGIVAGDTLSVDYRYRVNNSIEYSTAVHALSTSLGLFGQRYRLYGSFSQTDQSLISGVADVSPLTQQTYAQIGLDGKFDRISLGTSYLYLDSTLSTDRTTDAFINYLIKNNRSSLNLRLTERYTTTQQNEGQGESSGETEERNSISFNADYRRYLRRNLTMNLRGRVIDIRGQSRDQEDIYLGMILESRWYKFEFQMSADLTWQIYEDSTSREETVSFKIKRHF
ncbi:hypothetical protein [uncultured Desulfuromusa sp.]|uniref:hypothetical protein n=1 Tax=uncultured Desulfuromusa sp. TaxID=219183 RepID=UPI002AA7F59F|nr:hypothetical protein [uncultured Desulfuromusa sp.]